MLYLFGPELGQIFPSRKKYSPKIDVPGQTEDLHPAEEIWTTAFPTIKFKKV
jgi:hypothetical protein